MNSKELIEGKKPVGFAFTQWEIVALVLISYFVVDSYFSFLMVLIGVAMGFVTNYLVPAVILTTLICLLFWLIIFRLMLIKGYRRFKK